MITYQSTRGGDTGRSFEDVLLAGLAPDGGLYMPAHWPQIDFAALKGKSYNEIAEAVMWPFVEGSVDRADLRRIIDATYNEKVFDARGLAPFVEIAPNQYVMELFHGPTLAFKDFALQFLGRLFDHVLTQRNENITIVGATSGDTGSAAIEGCRHSAHTNIFILYPDGRVSDVQRRQMTTVHAPNVHNIALQGDFDACQKLVKAMFEDADFNTEMNLSAVNSINWARIMAQIAYYAYAATRYENASFVVPTGNFGNVLAGYAAKKMGAPIGKLVVATNENDILARFFASGTMQKQGVQPTLSPSMDIEVSSNFERYLYELYGRDAMRVAAVMQLFKQQGAFEVEPAVLECAHADFTAWRCDANGALAIMNELHAEQGYALDPHSAVGVFAARAFAQTHLITAQTPVITLATAHPAKFPAAFERATGIRPALPAHVAPILDKDEYFTRLPDDLTTVQDFIRTHQSPVTPSAPGP